MYRLYSNSKCVEMWLKKNVHKTLSFPYLQSASLKLYIKWSGRFFTNVFLSFSRFVHGRSIDIFPRYLSLIVAIRLFLLKQIPVNWKIIPRKVKRKGEREKEGGIVSIEMKLLISISAIFKCFSKLPYRNGICIAFTFYAARYRDYTVTYEVITEFWKRKTQRKRNIIRSIVFTARNSIPIDIGIILKYFSTHEKYTFL